MMPHAEPRPFNPDLTLRCPYCGGTVQADHAQGLLAHTLPACQRFVDEEPPDFLAGVRLALGGGDA